MRAAELAAAEGLAPQKVYWTATPRSVIESGFEAFAKSEDNPFAGVEKPEDIPFGTPDDQVAARIDAREFADHKLAALHAHATQIPPNSWLYVLAGSFGADFLGIEHFTLASGVKGPAGEESGLEDDLFAGVELPAPLPS
jgi:N-acetyl-1-D-myo-inositol-2-amino-2-deoxy-alpha-D-glucopyranoside deacetylase